MTWLAMIAALSLFTGIDYKLGGFIVRPFDPLVAIMGLALIAKVLSTGRLRLLPGFVWLLPFIVISVLSALSVSNGNGVREGLQMLIVLTFAISFSNADDPCPRGAKWKFLLCAMWALALFNAGWHINAGYVTGWKQLNELKHTISLATMLTVTWIALRHFRPSLIQLLAFGLLGGMLIMSGERKSLIVYAFALLTMASAMGFWRSFQVFIAPAAFAAIVVIFFLDAYIIQHYEALSLTTDYNIAGQPDSGSNQQRAFAFKAGMALLEKSPLVGIGTNNFDMRIENIYSFYPVYFLKGIHGEFFRVLVENGLVGFIAYMSVWVASILRTLGVARRLRSAGLITAQRSRDYLRIFFMFIVTSAVICGLEASGTDVYVILVLVSLWPDLFRLAVQQQPAQTRRPAESYELSRV